MNRRQLLRSLALGAAPMLLRGAEMTPRQRVDKVLRGQTPDRTPYSFWYHFLDESRSGDDHAKTTLEFHHKYRTDLVKVMSDYPYPKPAGEWFDLKFTSSPFPQQLRALTDIKVGLNERAHFVETLFNPANVAEKLSSKEATARLKAEKPQRYLDALEIIAKSQAEHARKAIALGTSGIFLSIANSADSDYAKFSEPFDRMIMESVRSAPLNILHIHGDHIDLDRFYKGWPVAGINYSVHGTKIPFETARQKYSGVLVGGWDEANFRKLKADELKAETEDAKRSAGPKLILAGGCSVPNDTTEAELMRVVV